ncbi:ATP-binding protein [Pseudomonas knackmussii]|uniref:ATP-binding protein n=1 Tax=Pseudomonas knackmussii TaxID=65741 RepID=UPI003F49D091
MDLIRRLCLFSAVLLCSLLQPSAAQELTLNGYSPPLADGWMTTSERDWLQRRGPLHVAVAPAERAPLQMINGDRFEGVSADYLALLLGERVHVRSYPNRQAALDALRRGEADLVAGGSQAEATANGLLRSRSYVTDPPVLVGDEARPGLAAGPGGRLAVVAGYLSAAQVRAAYPDSQVQVFDSTLGALDALSLGSVDGVLDDALSVHYLINMNYLFDLRIANFAPVESSGFGFLVREGDERLRDLLDHGLSRVGTLRREEILRRWSAGERLRLEGLQVGLTPRERQWLDAHPRVPVVVNRFTGVLAQVDADGHVGGILRDYLDLLGQRSGLHFDYVAVDDYNQMAETFATGQALLTPAVTPGIDGVDLLPPYLRASVVLAVATGEQDIHSLADMPGRRLSSAAGSAFNQMLRERYPQVPLVEATNQHESLRNVAEGRADAAIGSLFSIRPMIAGEFHRQLRLAGILEDLSTPFSIGVLKGQAELYSILEKAQLTVDPEELSDIVERWGARQDTPVSFWQMHRQLLLRIVAGAGLLIVLSLVWGFYLLRQVRRRRRAEQRLSGQLTLLSELIEAIPNPVYHLDHEGRLSLCNRAMLELFDCRLEDCQGRAIDELGWFAEDEAANLMQEYRQLVASGRLPLAGDRPLRLVGRELFAYRWAVAQRDAGGRVQGVIGGWVDLTERHRLMRELESERKRADAASAAKSQFLSAMSHEIRTPMNAIIGLQELALEKARDGQIDLGSLEVAQDAARTLLMLIGNVLDMARIESGRIDSTPSPVQLLRQIEGSVSLFLGLAQQKGLHLELVAGAGLEHWVLLDALRFKQVLFNLLNNAIKFTEFGGVTVRASARREGERLDLLIEVSDTGIGISTADQARLFRPFAQAEQPRQQEGTGLGLHISRRLVELMGGRLELRSELGQGSRFSIRLPLTLSAAPEALPEQAGLIAARRPLQVLAVDDHPANRLVFRQQLEYLGHRATLATGGQQAWELWCAGQFDAVLTDCRMSGGDGYELSRRIREHELRSGGPRCLIVGATANAWEEETQRCLEAGMDTVLFKPLTLEALRQALVEAGCEEASGTHGNEPQTAAAIFELEALFGADALHSDAACEFVRTLLEANEQDIAQLRELWWGARWSELGELAHRLAGVAAVICAQRAEASCRALQGLCEEREGDASFDAAVEAVEVALGELQAGLRQWLAQAQG